MLPSGPWAVAVLWAAFLLPPLLVQNAYLVSLANAYLISLILIASLNLVMGVCGQISLGQAGFFGVGAYASGVLNAKFGVSAWFGLLAALAASGLCAFVVGLPTLRLRGHYLAMATLGANAILLVLFNRLVGLTGGPNGLLGVGPFALGSLPLASDSQVFPVLWLVSLMVMLALCNVLDSRQGRAMRALAESEIGAASLGIDTFRTKLAAFTVSGALAGLAGSLYVHVNQFVSPETFSVQTSILLLVMVAVGGAGRFWGPFAGALLYVAIPQLLLGYDDIELLVFGAALIFVLIAFPGGLAGAVRLRRRRAR